MERWLTLTQVRAAIIKTRLNYADKGETKAPDNERIAALAALRELAEELGISIEHTPRPHEAAEYPKQRRHE